MDHQLVLYTHLRRMLEDKPQLLRFAHWMTTLEIWISYPTAVRSAVGQLASLFEGEIHNAGIHISERDLDGWVWILAYIPTADALALMRLLGQSQPGFGGDLLLCCARHDAPGNPLEAEARVSLARIAKLARFEIFERVFGPDRRTLVLSTLRELEEEGVK